MKSKKIWMSIFLVCCFVLSGCGSSNEVNSDKVSVAVVTAAAGQNDSGYNQTAVEGLKKGGEEFGVETKVVDKPEDIPGALTQLAELGYDLIFSLEYNFDALINGVGGQKSIAEQYPDTTFVVFNDNPNLNEDGTAKHSNVISVLFDVHESAFLAGVTSVLINENAEVLFSKDTHSLTLGEDGRKVGFIGGTKSNGITVFSYGFAQGVDYMASELGVEYTMYSDYNAGFSDSAAGATKANTYYSDGANIVFACAGSVGDGVTSKAKEVKKLAIEVDANKDANQSGYILTSVLKNSNIPVLDIMEYLVNGKINDIRGQVLTYSLSTNGTGITDLSEVEKYVVESGKEKFSEIKETISTVNQKINDGDINVINAQAGEVLDKNSLPNVELPND